LWCHQFASLYHQLGVGAARDDDDVAIGTNAQQYAPYIVVVLMSRGSSLAVDESETGSIK
jgi:hypothetical protein